MQCIMDSQEYFTSKSNTTWSDILRVEILFLYWVTTLLIYVHFVWPFILLLQAKILNLFSIWLELLHVKLILLS